MKKIAFVALFLTSKLLALPLGNPAAAGLLTNGSFFKKESVSSPLLRAISFRSAYWGDFVFNKKMQTCTDGQDIEKLDILTNALSVTVNFCERVDLFGVYGKSKFSLETNAVTFGGTSGNRFFLETDSASSYSLGARATLFNCTKLQAGIVFQYLFAKPRVDRITVAEIRSTYPHFDFPYKEWQIGFGLSCPLWRFSPYLSAKYSHSKLCFSEKEILVQDQLLQLTPLESRKHFGLATGISLMDSERMQITMEARFFDETAVFISREMRF